MGIDNNNDGTVDDEARYPPNFIRNVIEADVAAGKNGGNVMTRFPPEPNGYLHIGHAKAICLSFGIAKEFNGATNLRFDDTNPLKESNEFTEAIKRDIRWLGFEWAEERNASDYFEELYNMAERLISEGGNSPADILFTVDAGRLVRAKAKGLLQSASSEVINKTIPISTVVAPTIVRFVLNLPIST